MRDIDKRLKPARAGSIRAGIKCGMISEDLWLCKNSIALAEVDRLEAEIALKESMIEVLAVDAATLNAALIDIINGKKEKLSAILLPDYEAYDSNEKKREWAESEARKRLEVTDGR